MIGVLALLVFAQADGAGTGLPKLEVPAASVVAESPVRARVVADPERAQIGQPVVLTLVVDRPADVTIEPVELESVVLGSWMMLERIATRSEESTEDPARVVDTTAWHAFALEGGSALPPIEITYTGSNGPQKVTATAGAVSIPSVLAEGEDAARPAKGFRDPVSWVDGGSRIVLVAGVVLAAVALALLAWFLRRRRRLMPPIVLPTAAFELERIAREPRDDSAANRDVLYAVTRIVRSAVDAHVGEVRAARTDSEWQGLVAADARVPEGARAAARRLLERAERVKYAGDEPTRFATDEALADARAIVDALEPERRAA